MTPRELYEEAKTYGAEDFEMDICINITKDGDKWPNYLFYNINGICDVGYSDKAIRLDVYDAEGE